MEAFWSDLRYGVRLMLKKPGYAAVAIIALALGIGANTVVFSAVNAVLLRPLPYADPDRLVMVWGHQPEIGNEAASLPDFADWRAQSTSFERMAASAGINMNLTGDAEPERVVGARITADYLATLGVAPASGRDFLAEEDTPGAPRVAIIGDALWKRRFGANASVVGSAVQINGEPYTVVGVLPASFRFPGGSCDVLTPLATAPESKGRRSDFLDVVGRLKPGVSVESANAEMRTIAAGLAAQYPATNDGWSVELVPLRDDIVGETRPALYMLLAAVGLLLLIACANVANLLLARAASRRREIAIRAALGAGRGRIARQLLAEGVPLSLVGGGIGALLAVWGTDAVVSFGPSDVPRLAEAAVDGRVLLFTLVVSLLSGTLFGLLPAVSVSRSDPQEALKDGTPGAGDSRHRLRGALVGTQVGLALVLLVGTGLLVRSFQRLASVDPGFDASRLLTMRVSLPAARYKEDPQIVGFFDRLREGVSGLPGVEAVALVNAPPIGGGGPMAAFSEEGSPAPNDGAVVDANLRVVDPDYFHTMRIPLRSGRALDARDTADAPRVLVVNETLARRYWPNGDAVGKRISFGGTDDDPGWREIVGVVADVKHEGLGEPEVRAAYSPYAQSPFTSMTLVVRAAGDPAALAGAVRGEVARIDPNQPVYAVRTMDDIMARSVAPRRFGTWLFGLFGAVALLLAAVGIYGVVSYSVAQRTREIGIRMALGARAGAVVGLVVGQGMRAALVGLAAGALASLAIMRFASSVLFDVSPSDPVAFAGAIAVLGAVALAASYVPARRASRVDPTIALRAE